MVFERKPGAICWRALFTFRARTLNPLRLKQPHSSVCSLAFNIPANHVHLNGDISTTVRSWRYSFGLLPLAEVGACSATSLVQLLICTFTEKAIFLKSTPLIVNCCSKHSFCASFFLPLSPFQTQFSPENSSGRSEHVLAVCGGEEGHMRTTFPTPLRGRPSIGGRRRLMTSPGHITGSSGVLPADASERQIPIRKRIKALKNIFLFKSRVCYLTLSKGEVLLQTAPRPNPLMIKLVLIHLIQNKDINSILSNPLHSKLSARKKKREEKSRCAVLIKLVFSIIGSSEGAVN